MGAFYDYLGSSHNDIFKMRLEGGVLEPQGPIHTGTRFSMTWVVVNTGIYKYIYILIYNYMYILVILFSCFLPNPLYFLFLFSFLLTLVSNCYYEIIFEKFQVIYW